MLSPRHSASALRVLPVANRGSSSSHMHSSRPQKAACRLLLGIDRCRALQYGAGFLLATRSAMTLTPSSNNEIAVVIASGSLYEEKSENAVSPSEQKNAMLLTLEMRFGWDDGCLADFGIGSPQP